MEIKTIEPFLDYYEKLRARTLRIIQLIPPEKIEWTYKAGKFSFGDIIRHLAAIERFTFVENARLKSSRYPGHGKELAEGYDAVLAFMNKMHEESMAILSKLSADDLQKKCLTPQGAPITVWKWLRALAEHEIHHRGQLYLYLAMLEVPTPPLYGLTSEEVFERSQQEAIRLYERFGFERTSDEPQELAGTPLFTMQKVFCGNIWGICSGFISREQARGAANERRQLLKKEKGMSHDRDKMIVTHGMADIEPQLRLHFVTAGEGKRTVVLLHGFPQTWWEWHRVIPDLVDAGFHVVAPDYRGAGHSWRPHGGYDKRTMAGDIHLLLRQHLRIEHPVVLVGHDIGLMIAYAYAQAHRDEVSRLVVMDAPLPGTAVFDRLRADPRVWHFAFHSARDVPEMLIAGRERQYLQAFFNARIFDPGAISDNDLDIYTSAYTAPGAMRAGFELYRAFDRDADDNRDALKRNGKLTIPVLAVGGATSTSGPLVEEMMREVAEDVAGLRISGAAHWIAEENPAAFTVGLLEFLARELL